MASGTASPDPTRRDAFDFFAEERPRIADRDMNAHGSNVAVIRLMENARNMFIAACTPLMRGPWATFVPARFEIDVRGALFHACAPRPTAPVPAAARRRGLRGARGAHPVPRRPARAAATRGTGARRRPDHRAGARRLARMIA